MPSTPQPVEHWYEVIVGALGFSMLAAVYMMTRYFDGKKGSEPTPPAEIAKAAIGAAIVDHSSADTLAKIEDHVARLRELGDENEERRERDREAELRQLRARAARDSSSP